MSLNKHCEICNSQIHPLATFCKRCKKLIDRVDMRRKPSKEARVKALKDVWDGAGFRCYYTGIRLVENDSKDPRYITFDHRTPRNENDIVVTAALINGMKSDLDEDEFKAIIMQIANCFQGAKFDEKVLLNLKHWKR